MIYVFLLSSPLVPVVTFMFQVCQTESVGMLMKELKLKHFFF